VETSAAVFLTNALRYGIAHVQATARNQQCFDKNQAWSVFCQTLLTPAKIPSRELKSYAKQLSSINRIYSASLVYAMAQPASRRKLLAMYFTPPSLSEYVLDRAESFGADFQYGRFIDPAAGGASFIGPIASRMRARGATSDQIVTALSGIEIDPALADFARAAAAKIIERDATDIVVTGDGLDLGEAGTFDAVIGNPPYRVMTPSERRLMPIWARPALGNYANLYALFILRGFQLLREGGILAFLVPTSFITGRYFKPFRKYIAAHSNVLAIDTIVRRKEMFRNVSQDVCLIICRKEKPATKEYRAEARKLDDNFKWHCSEKYLVETVCGAPWHTLSTNPKHATAISLADLGYQVRCGPIVHNRDEGLSEGTRRKRRRAVPLVWGHVIKIGQSVEPASRHRQPGQGLVTFASSDRYTPPTTQPSIVLQRTNSGDQSRRIRAGFVDQMWIDKYGGFYGENHVVIVSPLPNVEQLVDLTLLWRILSSAAVDRRLRTLLTSNSVNVTSLRDLPMPNVKRLLREDILKIDDKTFEAFLEEAYER